MIQKIRIMTTNPLNFYPLDRPRLEKDAGPCIILLTAVDAAKKAKKINPSLIKRIAENIEIRNKKSFK